MKGKILVIQQWFGMGDQIFCQTIANDFIKEGYKVLWPASPSTVDGLNRAYPNVTFIDYNLVKVNYENKEFKEFDGILMLPMRYSESLMGKPYKFHMESKYSFLGKDWRRWKEGAVYKRDSKKEAELMDVLGIYKHHKDGFGPERYNLISSTFGSGGNRKIDIKVDNGFRNVEMVSVSGFSLFDWSRVIENAETIHAVSSASLYLFELLDLAASEVHIYNRTPIEQNLDFVRFLFSKNYILHE